METVIRKVGVSERIPKLNWASAVNVIRVVTPDGAVHLVVVR